MVVASKYLLKKWRVVGGRPLTAMLVRFSTHLPAPAPQQQQEPQQRVLRSLGKQSSLLSHFQRDAIAIRRLIEERRWDTKLEEALQSSTIPLCDGLVVEVIKSLSEAKLALRFFIWIAQQLHLRHLCLSFNTIAVLSRRWCHEKQFDTFLRTLHLQPQDMNPHSFHILLMGYGWAGMVEKAVETLGFMHSLGTPPTSSHFLCVLGILEREKLFNALPEVRERMQQTGFYPDAEMYKKLIWGLCVSGQKEEALNLFEEMKEKGESPGVEVYRILLSMFSKANRAPEVLKIFNELLNDEVEPDAKAFNALIKALCSDGKSQEALEVLEMMLGKALNPNLVSLTMVTDNLFNSGDVDKVLGLWEKLIEKSMTPTVTFQDRLVIELCNVGKLAEVEKIFVGLKQKNLAVSRVAYETFIIGLCKAKDLDRAGDCMLEMVEKLGKPDTETWNAMKEKLSKTDAEICKAILEKLGNTEAAVCNATPRLS
eukprot:c2800_g1_i1 orf=43-1488(+)